MTIAKCCLCLKYTSTFPRLQVGYSSILLSPWFTGSESYCQFIIENVSSDFLMLNVVIPSGHYLSRISGWLISCGPISLISTVINNRLKIESMVLGSLQNAESACCRYPRAIRPSDLFKKGFSNCRLIGHYNLEIYSHFIGFSWSILYWY